MTQELRDEIAKAATMVAPLFVTHGWTWADKGVPGPFALAKEYARLYDLLPSADGAAVTSGRLVVSRHGEDVHFGLELAVVFGP